MDQGDCGATLSKREPTRLFFLHQTTTFSLVSVKTKFGVYQSIPTSNHNLERNLLKNSIGVYQSIPTSNHNRAEDKERNRQVFISLFLHQTTTSLALLLSLVGCLSVYSYIKPQLLCCLEGEILRCLSVYSYIKPQPLGTASLREVGVYQSIPTSNHNFYECDEFIYVVFISLFLHQTTTSP